ncbi:hypothetical protein NKJ70_05840 [Mesorhizobium sp. M0092]|uniref:hypothetical protein n=1 Tax=Mesorhizobium sp. M0092 TaxID=2956876 RepID=UPI00333D75A7
MGIAYLSCASLRHILADHPDVKMLDMLCLPHMIKHGRWIGDRAKEACVVYDHPETSTRYKSAIKAVGEGYETYLTTFHRLNDRQLKSILKRGKEIV